MTAPDRIWIDDDTWFSNPVTYPHAVEYLRADVVEARLSDPAAVHINMLRGTIAKPTVEQIIHLYGREAFQPMIDAAMAKALEKACLAVSEHADWPEDAHGRTEQVGLFARVINAILAITPVVKPAPDAAAIREAALREAVNAAEAALNVPCAKCGVARAEHHHRHPFVPTGTTDPVSAILALLTEKPHDRA